MEQGENHCLHIDISRTIYWSWYWHIIKIQQIIFIDIGVDAIISQNDWYCRSRQLLKVDLFDDMFYSRKSKGRSFISLDRLCLLLPPYHFLREQASAKFWHFRKFECWRQVELMGCQRGTMADLHIGCFWELGHTSLCNPHILFCQEFSQTCSR